MIYLKKIEKIKKVKNYKIIPLGKNCVPRFISTYNGLKPSKNQGELSCPFDMAFFNSLDAIGKLISTKFENFFDDVIYDKQKNYYINESICAIFNHDGKLSKEEFENRYKKRISNFYEYIADVSLHKYFLIASFKTVKDSEIDILFKSLDLFMPRETYDIILINQNKTRCKKYKNKFNINNFYVIEDYKNFKNFADIRDGRNWILEIKKRDTVEAQKIFNNITDKLIKIISK